MAPYKPRRQSRIRKHHTPEQAAAIEEHSHLLGEVAWSWNRLHETYGYVFDTTLQTEGRALIGHVIWWALASDRAQRDILRAVLEWGFLGSVRTTKQLL